MKVHFIGIGGIGLSALARFLKADGAVVSGSDIKETSLTKKLRNEGIDVFIGHRGENIDKDLDYVVYTAVAKEDNPEIVRAKELNISLMSRAEFIKILLKDKKVLAVCGAHGKSTTTAILASLLPEATALIGAESKEFSSNFRKGNNLLVFEADESDGSFINSNPYISVVTNTEPEHMEFYNHNLKLFYEYYQKFLDLAQIRVVNSDDEFLQNQNAKKVSIKNAKNIRFEIRDNLPKSVFEYRGVEFEVYGFGEHLILDALLAIETANQFISLNEIAKNIKNYKGIKKRFDVLEKREDFILIDDYGHHPTEIKATLSAAKKFAMLNGIDRITAIWQPHKYSRTIDNLEEFVKCFEGVDELVILPVWSAGEEEIFIDFEKHFKEYNPVFADKIIKSKNIMLSCFDWNKKSNQEPKNFKTIEKGLVIGFGAGDITYQLRGEK